MVYGAGTFSGTTSAPSVNLPSCDRDDRHALLRHVRIGAERDRAGDAGEVLGFLERLLDRLGVGRSGALDRVNEQKYCVIAKRGKRILRVVAVFLVVGGR